MQLLTNPKFKRKFNDTMITYILEYRNWSDILIL